MASLVQITWWWVTESGPKESALCPLLQGFQFPWVLPDYLEGLSSFQVHSLQEATVDAESACG